MLALLALTGVHVALARPEVYRDQPRERATIMLVVDVSGSMAATDVYPYRLRAAQDAALTFADEVPRQYQVGLVSFSGQANVLVAPTTDRTALKRGIEGLRPRRRDGRGRRDRDLPGRHPRRPSRPRPGTATLEAARIVVLSDGTTTVGIATPTARPRTPRPAGVPIYTVALGTPGRASSPTASPCPPDPEGMKRIAEITGGKAYESTDADSVRDGLRASSARSSAPSGCSPR